MRENRTYGSEGGEAKAFPTPISRSLTNPVVHRRISNVSSHAAKGNPSMDEDERLSHTTWDCKYHVVFIPKC